MEPAELYHRTFLPDDPTLALNYVPGIAGKNLPLPPHRRRIWAYKMTEGSVASIWITEKRDQQFESYATPFERGHSKLIKPDGYDPVVDDKLTVVGHIGNASGSHLYVPENGPSDPSLSAAGVNAIVESGFPMFVDLKEGNGWRYIATCDTGYRVHTTIDGQVLACLGDYLVAGAVPTDFWPLDVLMIAAGLAQLGAAGVRAIVRSVARKNIARPQFLGATPELSRIAPRPLKSAVNRVIPSPFRGSAADELIARLPKEWKPIRGYIRESGMTQKHFADTRDAVVEMAKEGKAMVFGVRDTNSVSTRLIELGCEGKPFWAKFHTGPHTGVVTAQSPAEFRIAYEHRAWVVDAKGIARRPLVRNGRPVLEPNGKPAFEAVEIKDKFWKVERGQVLHPDTLKPYVGDYDAQGAVLLSNPGQNVALAAKGEVTVVDITSPLVEDICDRANKKMGEVRFLHGAQDQFAGFRGGATFFFPDGSAMHLDENGVKKFYEFIGRQPKSGQYPRAEGPGRLGKLVGLDGGKK